MSARTEREAAQTSGLQHRVARDRRRIFYRGYWLAVVNRAARVAHIQNTEGPVLRPDQVGRCAPKRGPKWTRTTRQVHRATTMVAPAVNSFFVFLIYFNFSFLGDFLPSSPWRRPLPAPSAAFRAAISASASHIAYGGHLGRKRQERARRAEKKGQKAQNWQVAPCYVRS